MVLLFYFPIYKKGVNSKAGLQSILSRSTQQLGSCDSVSDADMSLKFSCQKKVQREVPCPRMTGGIYPQGMSMYFLHAAAQHTEKWKFLATSVLLVFNKKWFSQFFLQIKISRLFSLGWNCGSTEVNEETSC